MSAHNELPVPPADENPSSAYEEAEVPSGYYQVLGPIGSGPVGTVYRALRPTLGREVAVKVLHSELAQDEDAIRRFWHGGQVAARLKHPNILPVHYFGREGDQCYIVMEHIASGSAAQRLEAWGALAPGDALAIVQQAAQALDYAADEGVLHLNLKPSNLLLGPDGQVFLCDWHDVAEGDRDDGHDGRPALPYEAPELQAGAVADRRADVYGLGAVAYQLLTGHAPLLDPNGKLPPTATVNQRLPRTVHRVLQQALASQKDRRYPTAGAFAAALSRALRVPRGAQGREQALLPIGSPWPRRLVLSLAGVALLGGCAYMVLSVDWSPPPPVVVTATPWFTRTRAPTRTPTPTRALSPTATAEPTVSETPQPAATAAKTAPALPPVGGAQPPVSATPAPTLEPAPALLTPVMGAQLNSTFVSFSWEWWRVLGASEHFDIRLWRQGQPPNGVAWVDAPHLTMPKLASGVYYWSVTVVRETGVGADGAREWQPVSETSVVRSFAYFPDLAARATPTP